MNTKKVVKRTPTKGPFTVIGFDREMRLEDSKGRVVAKIMRLPGQNQFDHHATACLFSAADELRDALVDTLKRLKQFEPNTMYPQAAAAIKKSKVGG